VQHSSLLSFLNGSCPASELWFEIQAEVTECLAACAKGGSGSVILSKGPKTQVTRKHLTVLLTALAEAKVPLAAASYLADALIMSDDFEFEDSAVVEEMFFLSDESAPLTLAEIKKARSRLATAS